MRYIYLIACECYDFEQHKGVDEYCLDLGWFESKQDALDLVDKKNKELFAELAAKGMSDFCAGYYVFSLHKGKRFAKE